MAYTVHNFEQGDVLYAEQLNEMDEQIAANEESIEASISSNMLAEDYSANKTYSIGDYVVYNNELYTCIYEITAPEGWNSAHWQIANLGDGISDLSRQLSDVEENQIHNLKSAIQSKEVNILNTDGWELFSDYTPTSGGTNHGITVTRENGLFVINGTSNAASIINLYTAINFADGYEYLLTGCPSGGSDSTFSVDYTDAQYGAVSDFGNGVTIYHNMGRGNPVIALYIRASGVVFDNVIADICVLRRKLNTQQEKQRLLGLFTQSAPVRTVGGVTCTWVPANESYILNGTATGANNLVISATSPNLENNTIYEFSYEGNLPEGASVEYSNFVDFSYSATKKGTGIKKFDYSIYPNSKFIILFNSGTVFNNVVIKPYLYYGQIPTIIYSEESENYSIGCLGDSITQQGQYTSALQNLHDFNVTNYGVSGTAITIDVPGYGEAFYKRVPNMDSGLDMVFMFGGTNDWSLDVPLGDPSDTTDSSFYGGLYLTLTALRQKYPTKPIFVGTIMQRNYTAGGQYSGMMSNGNSDSILDFNEAVVYMAKLFGCYIIDLFDCGICQQNMSNYLSDGLHPNAVGGAFIADYINNAIRKMPLQWP